MYSSAQERVLSLPIYLGARDIQSLGFSRSLAYAMFRRADFPTIQIGGIGGRKFVQRESFFKWLDDQSNHTEADSEEVE